VIRPGSLIVLCALALLPAAARADVVVLTGNDIPLVGEILSEDRTHVFFRIRGMTAGERVRIERGRIRRYWHEAQTAWERPPGKRTAEYPGLASLFPPPVGDRTSSATSEAAADAPAQDGFARAMGRFEVFVPSDPGLRVLFWLAGFGALSLLFHLGARLTELEKLGLGRGAILALVTQFLILLGILACRSVTEPMTFPLLVSALIVAWVIVAHMLGGDRVSKAVLLFSFCTCMLLLVAVSLFSVSRVL